MIRIAWLIAAASSRNRKPPEAQAW